MNWLLTLIVLLHTYTGVATIYDETWAGNPLYCNNGINGLTYDRSTGPWVAVDVRLFESGAVQCGDTIEVRAIDGSFSFYAPAYDAGLLSTRTFRGGQAAVVDTPEYWAPWLETGPACPEVTIVNWSAVQREYAAGVR